MTLVSEPASRFSRKLCSGAYHQASAITVFACGVGKSATCGRRKIPLQKQSVLRERANAVGAQASALGEK
jgi:hypothetical protein